jgi:iron complex outermembrane receptor protein
MIGVANAGGPDSMDVGLALDEAVYSEEFFFQEVPSVITATRLRQSKAQTPASVTVIDRAMIDASGFLEIVDLLRLVPGFQVAHADGRVLVATSHGQSGQYQSRLQVLVDGRSVYIPLLSSADWTVLGVQMDDIDRIEVIRGPNASAYGANAFLGTVNIITRQPFLDRGNYVAVRAGDPGMRNVTVRHGDSVRGMDYRVTGNYRTSDGYVDQDDEYDLGSISFRGALTLTPADALDVHLGIDTGDTGAGGADSVLNPERKRDVDSHYEQLKWRHRMSAESDLTIQFYHNYYRHDDSYTIDALLSELFGVDPDQIPLFFDGQPDQKIDYAIHYGKTHRYDLEFQHSTVPGNNHRLVWGGGLRQDRLSSEFMIGRSDAVKDNSARVFFNSEIATSKSTTVNLGLMVEHGDIVDTQYSPRVALNWAVNPHNVLRASVSVAHRTPALLENNWDYASRFADGSLLDQRFITEDDLKPEKIISQELGYVGEFPEQRLFLEAKVFRERIYDVLTLARDETWPDPIGNGAHVARNGGSSDIRGIEGQIIYRPALRRFIALQHAYAEADAFELTSVNPDQYRERDEATPRHTTSLLASYGFSEGVSASIGFYHISKQLWTGEGDEVPAYKRVDVKLANGYRMATGTGELAFVLQNVEDEYNEFRDQNLFDTRAYIEFKWTQKQ